MKSLVSVGIAFKAISDLIIHVMEVQTDPQHATSVNLVQGYVFFLT